tara:strand:+ start:3211 stop:5343 length:2133 start_codon:yes stop_codon:yes gene_type:complete
MSQSSGVLLSSLGQGLVQFAGVYGDTKTSSLEAEGQRLKEMRLQEMQANRNTLTDAFRVAEYDSSQERLSIAKNAEARAQADFDKPDYFNVPIKKYGWVTETKQVFDDMTKTYVNTETREWKAISSGTVFVNKVDKTDSFIINADGTRGTVDEASTSPTPPKTTTTGTASAVMQTFPTKAALVADIKEQHKAAGEKLKPGEADTLADKALESGLVALTNAETPPPTAELSDAELAFIEEELGQSKLSRSAQTVVEDTVKDLWKNFKKARDYHKPTATPSPDGAVIDVRRLNPDSGKPDTTSLLERVQAYHGESSAQSADVPQQLPAGEIPAFLTQVPPSSGTSYPELMHQMDRNAMDAAGTTPSPVTDPQQLPAGEIPAFLTQAPPSTPEPIIPMGERFRNPGGSAISVAGIDVSSPVTGPQQLPAGEIPSFPDRVGRSKTELVIESWMGAIPRAISHLMPIEYSQFLKSYPTLKAAREAEANQIGEDKISFTSAWKTVAKWVESQNLDIAPGGGAITEEVLDSAAEASAPATIRAEFGIPPDVNPMPDRTRNPGDTGISVPSTLPPARTFDPSDGMGVNSSLANAGSFPATGGIISAPPTEEQQKNLDILESLRKQGSFGNKVEPEPVNLAPVGQTVSQASTSPDTSSNKDAKTQVLEIVAAMEQANIGKEVIRKELLRLLELIKPAEAESPYARALAEVYVEFTKEAN